MDIYDKTDMTIDGSQIKYFYLVLIVKNELEIYL